MSSVAKPAELEKLTGVASRFGAFVAERYPFALIEAVDAWEATTGGREPKGEAAFEALRPAFRRELARRLGSRARPSGALRHHAADERRQAHRAGAALAARRVRRVSPAAGDRGLAHARGTARDPPRHDPHARHRQPPEGALSRRRSAIRGERHFRERAFDRSARKRSTAPRCGCAAADVHRAPDATRGARRL